MARGQANTTAAGIWKKDSVKDVAESVGIANLPDEVATALAGDVEYRLWEIIEESIKFMRHSRRTRLKVEDVDHALKARNLEPLWGFASTSHLPFKKTVTPTGIVYHVDDEEIDLSKVLKSELPSVPRDVSFTAHWLAIEGVQPLIKENPSPAELAKFAPRASATANVSTTDASGSTVTPLVKHVLSRELQLYFTRLTEALGTAGAGGSSSQEMRDAALGSVRSDPGLHQLVPYLVGWGESSEQIANHLDDLSALERALDLFHAMLENPTLFIEPYLHQLTPPVLTCLLTSSLPPPIPNAYPSPLQIRTSASSLLHLLLTRHSASYPSLRPRITKTLLRGVGGESRGLGARWGAARGLSGIVGGMGGNKAVREWLGGGLKALGETLEAEEETEVGERAEVVREVFNVLKASLLVTDSDDSSLAAPPPMHELHDRYGPLFGQAVAEWWDRGGREIYEAVPGASAVDGDDEAGSAMEE
ncbi:TATA box binding protein associated factor-domain-containing protein [Leucosporidium creatinivorum]|uniref:TBP-associated factor 6 n=1 Tax=Leucosporidium creatinivorum TaxID=106004 RepID=A0A1Y2CDM6_9BASI|nr:TATA box binding protein associated factor-domain-containing protein [Leucosporidium creatinivorum]